jgi:hypothetical protein
MASEVAGKDVTEADLCCRMAHSLTMKSLSTLLIKNDGEKDDESQDFSV